MLFERLMLNRFGEEPKACDLFWEPSHDRDRVRLLFDRPNEHMHTVHVMRSSGNDCTIVSVYWSHGSVQVFYIDLPEISVLFSDYGDSAKFVRWLEMSSVRPSECHKSTSDATTESETDND